MAVHLIFCRIIALREVAARVPLCAPFQFPPSPPSLLLFRGTDLAFCKISSPRGFLSLFLSLSTTLSSSTLYVPPMPPNAPQCPSYPINADPTNQWLHLSSSTYYSFLQRPSSGSTCYSYGFVLYLRRKVQSGSYNCLKNVHEF